MKKIFLLGSGSSIGHSRGTFPSILGFFSMATELGLYGSEATKEISNYVRNLLGLNIFSKHSKIDIEALFTFIEIEIERNPSPNLLLIRQELLKLIQAILINLEDRLLPGGEYNLFLEDLKPPDTIITFNWDILLDNLLSRTDILTKLYKNKSLSGLLAQHYETFIFKLSAFSEGTWDGLSFGHPYEKWNPENGYYLKTHGSIDWFYCANEACRAFRKVFPAINPQSKHYCSECHEQLEFLIIPPVLNKSYRQYPIIRRIWNLATKEMELVNILVIWGYSLPPTDFYASWLLRLARAAPLEKVILINPAVINKTKSKVSLSFVRRYFDLFRYNLPKENLLLYETYTDYHDNLDVFQKYPIKNQTESFRYI